MARSVLVTGASTGIGAACVERLAQDGWTVFAGIRRRADGDRLAAEIPGDVRPLVVDVTDEEQIEDAVTEMRDAIEGDGLHGLINNAGLSFVGPVELVPTEDWRRQFEVNVFGALALTRAAFDLVRSASGRFVYIGSQAGRFGPPGMAPYAASKHALEAICESLRHELASTPMQVSLIEAGNVKTPIWAKGEEQVRRMESLFDEDRGRDYAFLVAALVGLARDGAARGIPPRKVAAEVEHALTATRPKARYLVGADAKAIGLVLTRLPDRWRNRAFAALTRRWIRLGRAPTRHRRPDNLRRP